MNGKSEEDFRWRLARVAVWIGIFTAVALFWSGAAVLVAGAIR